MIRLRWIFDLRVLLAVSVLGAVGGLAALRTTGKAAPYVASLPRPADYLTHISTDKPVAGEDPAVFPGTSSSAGGRVVRDKLEQLTTCGQAGCHPDVTRQWNQSMHHLASFNNPFYRKSVDYTRERQGDKGVRWCAGCHDPVLLLSGNIDGEVTPDTPGAQAGVTCVVCHSISHVQDLTGNGRYTMDVHDVRFLQADSPVFGLVKRLLPLAPRPHKEGFLKPVHKVSEFCSSCHRVGLTPAQNAFHWLRGQDQFGGWQNGGASGRVARSFYTPPEGKRCQDCHMPLVASSDAGAKNGMIRSHSFPGANTAMPGLAGFPEQVALTTSFLVGSMRVDLFAVREFSQVGGQEDSRWLAPLETARLTPGSDVTLDVVVRNLRVGHGFPEGVLDNKDVWLEVTARDARGQEVWRQGGLDEREELRPGSHLYGALLLDEAGQRIDKRNIGDFRVPLYRRVIDAGQSDVARYRFRVPADCGGSLTFQARLRYRKVKRDYTRWTYAGRRVAGESAPPVGSTTDTGRFEIDPSIPIPSLPVVEVATDQVTVPVGEQPLASAPPLKKTPLTERWYDYGVGLLLQADTDRARRAFVTVSQLFPDFIDGPTGLARVELAQGNPDAALRALTEAQSRLERHPPTASEAGPNGWGKYSRIPGLWGLALLRRGDYAEAADMLSDLVGQFPKDRSLWADLGYAYFQHDDLDKAVKAYQRVLEIDPDDRGAHGMLARTYRRLGRLEASNQEEAIFSALREDVSVQGLRQKYLEHHPEDSLEAQVGHEHAAGPVAGRGLSLHGAVLADFATGLPRSSTP